MADAPHAEETLTAALARAPRALAPAAADWQAVLVLAVTDAEDRTLRVEAGQVRVERGAAFRRTARFEADAATWAQVLGGTLAVDEAFRDGRLRTAEPAVLLRFARAFDWAAAAAEGPRSAGPVARPWPLPPAVEGQPPVGKRYDGGWHLVTAEDVQAYAQATHDPHPAYEGPGALAPPMFHVRPMRDLLFGVMEDPELGLDMLRLLHGEHDATFHRPLQVGQVLHCRGLLERVEEKRSGLLVVARFHGLVQGELAVEARSSFFVRHPATGPETPAAPPPTPEHPETQVFPLTVTMDQSWRYAEASLDRNPLHLDREVAQKAGFPDVIVHGLCTMALAGAEIVRRHADADPRRLHRLALRWARPVFNGDALLLRTWPTSGSDEVPPAGAGLDSLGFDVLGPDGHPVVVAGRAELR